MAKSKRKAGEINSSSMADIAFLLLIFFLVTTTMDVDSGMKRTLPPIADNEQQQDDVELKERNVLMVNVSKEGRIMVGTDEYMPVDLNRRGDHSRMSREVLDFLAGVDRSEKKETEIEPTINCEISQGVVSLKADNETKYSIYLQVQDELTHAFNVYRDLISVQAYGKPFDELNEIQAGNIRKAVPVKVSEAEPNDQTRK
ncbi:MAG: biopolymer transporter ExbD [Alistipes sp.]|nr:biopolymer transporter ExbD [Alistipes sp.]MEE0864317.1 biopolymer transporter ExbD [Alistipes sp.]